VWLCLSGLEGAVVRIAYLGVKGIPYTAGIEDYVEAVGARLAERGHDVWVYCRKYYTKGDSSPYLGVKRIHTAGIHSKHLDAATHTLTASLHALFAKGIDIAHYHAVGPSLFSPILRLKPRTKIVTTVHSFDWERAKWGALARFALKTGAWTALHVPHATTAVSAVVKQQLEEAFRRPVHHIAVGAPVLTGKDTGVLAEHGLTPGGYVAFIGRLTPEKGCHYLVEAYKRLDTAKVLAIAGDDYHATPYLEALKRNAGDRIRFLGWVSADVVEDLLRNAYLFVLPSEIEGLSQVAIRSMACGCSVLASDIPNNQEVLGECGFTFRQGDVDDLVDRLGHLLAHEDEVAENNTRSRERARREYDWERIVGQYEALYNGLLGR